MEIFVIAALRVLPTAGNSRTVVQRTDDNVLAGLLSAGLNITVDICSTLSLQNVVWKEKGFRTPWPNLATAVVMAKLVRSGIQSLFKAALSYVCAEWESDRKL